MKKIYSLLFSLLVIGGSALAAPKISEENTVYGYGDAFIFIEGGVEFAVYPDGQFDFFFNQRRTGYNVNVFTPNINISFNSGYNYDPFVQYDDFGAVIQIERVPLFYDYYGRLIQAGNVYLSYNHFGRLSRIGGLHLHYNHRNHFSHYTGYVNPANPYYVHRPWHSYYVRPHSHYAIVHHQPYRAYYAPSRVSFNYHYNFYSNNYSNNRGYRRSYYRPGEQVSSYQRGSRATERRDLRPQQFNSDYTVATRLDDRNNSRSNATTRNETRSSTNSRTARDSKASQAPVNRGRESRPTINNDLNTRESRTVRQPATQQKQDSRINNTRGTARDTGFSSSNRNTRANAPAARSSNREAAVKAPARTSSPQPASSGNSRSSRGRGN